MGWVIVVIVFVVGCLTAPWWSTDSRVGRDWQWKDPEGMNPWITQQLAEERIRGQHVAAERFRRLRAARPRVGFGVRAVFGGVRRNGARLWRDSEAAQRRLIARNRPWESDGPLRWQRRAGGWELHGYAAPEAPAPTIDLTESGDESIAPEDARA